MDLSYYADTPYKNTQYYNEIVSLVGSTRLDQVFMSMRIPYINKKFYTDPAYMWFRSVFLLMAPEADWMTVNCTGGGILFGPGIDWMKLEDFLNG